LFCEQAQVTPGVQDPRRHIYKAGQLEIHDSNGIECDVELYIKTVKAFLEERARSGRVEDQVHIVW
jgi:hypothetical protein